VVEVVAHLRRQVQTVMAAMELRPRYLEQQLLTLVAEGVLAITVAVQVLEALVVAAQVLSGALRLSMLLLALQTQVAVAVAVGKLAEFVLLAATAALAS
jgi:hypothetical protein